MLASLHSGIAHLVTVGALVFSNSTVPAVWRVQRLALLLQGTSNSIAELAAHIHHMQCVNKAMAIARHCIHLDCTLHTCICTQMAQRLTRLSDLTLQVNPHIQATCMLSVHLL